MIPNKVYIILLDLLPMVILFSVVMSSVRLIYARVAHEKIIIHKEFKSLIYIVYCFVLFKLVTTTDFESFSNNFTPLKEITRYEISSVLFFRNVIGNIILFIPFGYLITDMLYEKIGKYNGFITCLITLITSTTIEVIQMYIGRSFDIDDILLNFVGGILGFIVFVIVRQIFKLLPKGKVADIIKNTICVIIVIVLLILFLKFYEVIL